MTIQNTALSWASLAAFVVVGGCDLRAPQNESPPVSSRSLGSASASRSAGSPAASSSLGAKSRNPSASASAVKDGETIVWQGPPAPCPLEMARVGWSCIDRFEAHLVTVGDDGKETALSPYQRPPKSGEYRAKSERNVAPQAYINRFESQKACKNAGKRICTLGEWYRACRGPRGFTYPYGARMDRKKCNISKPHLLSKLFGTDPRAWKYDEHFNDPTLNQQEGFLAKTGGYAACVSGYGVYDLVGNLHEWVSDTVTDDLVHKVQLRDDIRDKIEKNYGHAIFMGGFFSTTSQHGRGCNFTTIGHGPKYHDYSTGFRCCKKTWATPPKG